MPADQTPEESARQEGGTTVPEQPEWSTIQVGSGVTRILEAGPRQASEATVFIHGNPGSAGDWVGPVEAVGQIGRAVAFDLPDFGQSEAPPGFGNTVGEYAAFVGQALDALGVARVNLVLHDFGGPIGLLWAAGNLDRVASVTLFNTGILIGYRWHTMARVWQTPVLGEISQAIISRPVFRRVVSSAEPRGLPRPFLDEMFDNYDRRTRSAVLRLYRSARDVGDRAAELATVLAGADIPALVIWGEGDSYLPARFAEAQREAFPSAEIHPLPDSGHWPFIDDPDASNVFLTSFLKSLS
jgi:pimeloyl-ACP methyl ester carboxylesterase